MNLEKKQTEEASAKKRTALLVLKITGIVLASLLALSLIVGGVFYLVFSVMYNNGIYDSSVEFEGSALQNPPPDWDELDPVLVALKITKEKTVYNVLDKNLPKEEYTNDITVKAVYYINGSMVEKETESYTVGVENNMLTTVGEKKITIRFTESYGQTLPDAYKGITEYLSIPIKVVDDNSGDEKSVYEKVETINVYRGDANGDRWHERYADEYEDIKNMTLDPIVPLPQRDSDIVNILILGTASNDVEPELQRKKLETIIIASYNTSSNDITLLSVHNQLLGTRNENVYPLAGVYAIGGAGATVNSVNAVLGTDIQHYVEIDLDSFIGFINKLGGVSVNLTQEEIDALMLTEVAAGEAILNGENAEKYLTDNGSDAAGITKTDRQRKLLSSLLKKLLGMPSITAFKTIAADESFVKTNLPFSTVIKYALSAVGDISDLSFNRYFAPYGEYGKDYAYVVTDEKYRVYYSNVDYLRNETKKYLGYTEAE